MQDHLALKTLPGSTVHLIPTEHVVPCLIVEAAPAKYRKHRKSPRQAILTAGNAPGLCLNTKSMHEPG